MTPQVFVDLDGVLADFDTHYERLFGRRPDKTQDNADWRKVVATPGFYATMPLMADAWRLWDFVRRLTPRPIILTGCPKAVPESAVDKCIMVEENFGREASDRMICCASRDKRNFLRNHSDILIDDWERYRDLWIGAGGRWITHTSAENSITQLLKMGIGL